MDRDARTAALRLQAGACRHYDSPLYADLLEAALAEGHLHGRRVRWLDAGARPARSAARPASPAPP